MVGLHGSILGAVIMTHRQRTVPAELRGRVQGAFMMLVVGGNALGAQIGGPIARWWGITGPFWFAAVTMTALTALAWGPFGRKPGRAIDAGGCREQVTGRGRPVR